MNEAILEELGLSPVEIRLYQAVAKAKQLAPAALAKAIGVKRTTAYSMARALVERGFLTEDSTQRPRVFTPASPDDLRTVIETEKARSKKRQDLLAKLAEEVSITNAESAYPVPRIKFIEEGKMDEFFHQAFTRWNESMLETKEYGFWGFQDSTLVDHFEGQLHYWWKIAPKEFYVNLLTNLTHGEKKIAGKYERRQMKYWGEATDFISSTWIAGDYVTMINTRQKPFYAIEIKSRLLAHDQREVFKNLWPLIN
jgi:predicted transcriptional regulator